MRLLCHGEAESLKQAKSTKSKLFTTWPFKEKKKMQALPCTVKPTLTSEGLLCLPHPHPIGSLETSGTCAKIEALPAPGPTETGSVSALHTTSSPGRCPATATSSQPPSEDLLSGTPALWKHPDQGQATALGNSVPSDLPFHQGLHDQQVWPSASMPRATAASGWTVDWNS